MQRENGETVHININPDVLNDVDGKMVKEIIEGNHLAIEPYDYQSHQSRDFTYQTHKQDFIFERLFKDLFNPPISVSINIFHYK